MKKLSPATYVWQFTAKEIFFGKMNPRQSTNLSFFLFCSYPSWVSAMDVRPCRKALKLLMRRRLRS